MQNGTCGIAYRNGASGTVERNIITSNSIGINCDSGSPTIKNNILSGNTGSYAICVSSTSNPTIVHNTIDNNNGDGIHIACGSSPIIKNNIISLNGSNGMVWDTTDAPIFGYNNVWNNNVNYVNVTPGPGSISQNPLFTGIGNYHFTGSSPCIDAGTDVGVYMAMDGDTRPQGTDFDISVPTNIHRPQ